MTVMKRGMPAGVPLPTGTPLASDPSSAVSQPHPRASAPPSPHPLPRPAAGVPAAAPPGLISSVNRLLHGGAPSGDAPSAVAAVARPVAAAARVQSEMELVGMNRIASVAWTGYDGSGELGGSGNLAPDAESLQGSGGSSASEESSELIPAGTGKSLLAEPEYNKDL